MTNVQASKEGSIDSYFQAIDRHPLLTKDEEVSLAKRKRDHGDLAAAHRLVNCNLRFVVKIAHEYEGYGMRLDDLVQEGNVGLIKAVQRFDPDRGVRLISYAVWWIRAYVQNFIISSWSLVKVGTTQTQRRLFFKLRSERNETTRRFPKKDSSAIIRDIADRMGLREKDVRDMELRLAGRDSSLDKQVRNDSTYALLDWLKSPRLGPDEEATQAERAVVVRQTLGDAAASFNERERYIVRNRVVNNDAPETLQEIGNHFHFSRERARQIETVVKGKLRAAFEDNGIQHAAI